MNVKRELHISLFSINNLSNLFRSRVRMTHSHLSWLADGYENASPSAVGYDIGNGQQLYTFWLFDLLGVDIAISHSR